MRRISIIIVAVWMSVNLSCDGTQKASRIEIAYPKSGTTVHSGRPLTIKLDFGGNEDSIDSVNYSLDGEHLTTISGTDSLDLSTENWSFGNKSLKITAFHEGRETVKTSQIKFTPPPAKKFGFNVVREYPHDNTAFTQGLEYHNGVLFESTGQYDGRSSIRQVDLNTGEIIKKVSLGNEYFGEGLTIVDDRVIQLTWMENKAFVYDRATLGKIGEFSYGSFKEGWGICFDGTQLIVSDGSNRLYFLNKDTFEETEIKEVFDHRGPRSELNELEYIDGKIYANVYQENIIVIIDPKTGAVEGEINLIGLFPEAQNLPYDHELNGIAYDRAQERLFVTGKNWSKLFEIALIAR